MIRLCRHFQFLFSGLRLHGLGLGRRDFCFCRLCRLRNFRLCGDCLLSRLLPAAVPEGFRCGGNLPAGGLGRRCIRREEPPCRLGQSIARAGLLRLRFFLVLFLRQRVHRRLGGHGYINIEIGTPGLCLCHALAQGIHSAAVCLAHLPGRLFHHTGVESHQGGTGEEHQADKDAQSQNHQSAHPAAGVHQRHTQQRTDESAALHGSALGIELSDHLSELLTFGDSAAARLYRCRNQHRQQGEQDRLHLEAGIPAVRGEHGRQIDRDQCRTPGHDSQQAEHGFVRGIPDAFAGQEHQRAEQQTHCHQDNGAHLPLGTQPGFPGFGALPAAPGGFFGCGFFCASCHERTGLLFYHQTGKRSNLSLSV